MAPSDSAKMSDMTVALRFFSTFLHTMPPSTPLPLFLMTSNAPPLQSGMSSSVEDVMPDFRFCRCSLVPVRRSDSSYM